MSKKIYKPKFIHLNKTEKLKYKVSKYIDIRILLYCCKNHITTSQLN